jgi:NCS1 family nucleobase:cation symporter-1
MAVGLAALFSIGTVWLPALQSLSGFGWLIGAGVGGVLYILFCGSRS